MSETIRSLSKLVITTHGWPGNNTSIRVTLTIRKEDNGFIVSLVATNDNSFGYILKCSVSSLSDAVTKYDFFLNEYFHAIPVPVSQDWFVDNGFTQFSKG